MAIDFKKTEKDLYQPGTKPSIIEVPEMLFIMIDGHGDPNTSEAYQTALEILLFPLWKDCGQRTQASMSLV